ncbi:MAG: N-6 DNA methylase [Planctomycetota bacterium]|nr:N-6 DNA methylase [Planctomycetota bacterium]
MSEAIDPRGVVATPPELARRVAELVPRGARVLDPCCGRGALLLAVRDAGVPPERLVGIELSPTDAAHTRAALPGARLEVADALSVPWPPGTWVIANPPWCSFSGRQRSSITAHSDRGWPSLHGAFLEQIAAHVQREGTGAVVLLPASVLELAGYGPLRARVTRHVALAAPPIELPEDAFPCVIEPAVLLLLTPSEGCGSPAPWTTPSDPIVDALAPFPRLPRSTFADPGVHTGNSSRMLIHPEERTDLPGVRQGRDLKRWSLGPPSARLDVHLERSSEQRFRIPPLEHMQSFPVLLRQTAARPMAALHTAPTYFRNSLLAVREVEGLDARFVASVLNAQVLADWHRAAHLDARQRAFPQLKVRHLRAAPFPIAHQSEDPSLHDALVAAYGNGPLVDRLVAEAFGISLSRTGS